MTSYQKKKRRNQEIIILKEQNTMTKKDLLKALEQVQDGYLSNITFPLAMDFIRAAGKYDFFINDFTGEKKALYIRLYNSNGEFFDNHLWGFYSTKEIAKIFYNIIKSI